MTPQIPTIGKPSQHSTAVVLALVILAVAATALLHPGAAGASAAIRANPTAVASVNLERLIFSLDEHGALTEEARKEFDRRQKEIDALVEEIESLEADIKRLDPASLARATMQRDLDMKRGFLELRFSRLVRWQSEDDAILLTTLYEKALLAIEEVAKRDGWDMVIHTTRQNQVPRELNIRPEQARAFVLEWIQSRRVLHTNEATDITGIVATHMNNKYATGR